MSEVHPQGVSVPTRGRPRDPGLEGRALDAAIDLYAETGWAGFSFEAVARRASVGKASLYARWPTRAALLAQTLETRWLTVGRIDTGSLRGDLTALAHMLFDIQTGPKGGAGRWMGMDSSRYDEVQAVAAPYREATVRQGRAIARRAIARGEVDASVNPGLLMDLLVGAPQRTPVIYQAGASGRGVQFGAKHAEGIFCVYPNIESARPNVAELRAAAVAAGREAGDLKIIQGVAVIVAPTDEEARIKERTYRGYASREAALALFSGWAGIDLAALPPGTRLEDCEWNAIQSLKHLFRRIDPDREWTLDAIGEFMEIGSVFPKIIGSPATVADELERWMDETDVDGFNVHAVVQPAGFTEFVDMVVPELQRRGRMREAYEGSTLRENYFGAGHKRLKPTHAAFKALPPWKLG